MSFQCLERTCRCQRVEFTALETGCLAYLPDASITTGTSLRCHSSSRLLAKSLDQPHAETQGRTAIITRLERTVPVTLIDIDAADLDTMTPGILRQL